MWTRKAVVLAAVVGVITACSEAGITDPDRPFDLGPLLTITNPNQNLTAAEEAELRARAKITKTDLKVGADGLPTGANIEVFTEGTIPFKIYFPRFKHDVQYQVLNESGTINPQMIPGDWHLGEPQTGDLKLAFRLEYQNISVPCETEGSNAGLWVQTHHRARWQYFKLGSLLKIQPPPIINIEEDQCPRRTATRSEERSRPPNEMCLVSIWYDLDTLEVLSVNVLYCWFEPGSGGGDEDPCPDCMSPSPGRPLSEDKSGRPTGSAVRSEPASVTIR